jgi:hypothetical protein
VYRPPARFFSKSSHLALHLGIQGAGIPNVKFAMQ